jgi:hypothetical protein
VFAFIAVKSLSVKSTGKALNIVQINVVLQLCMITFGFAFTVERFIKGINVVGGVLTIAGISGSKCDTIKAPKTMLIKLKSLSALLVVR